MASFSTVVKILIGTSCNIIDCVFLQPCLDAEFFYFGLRFCHIKTTIGVLTKTFTLSSFCDIDKGCRQIQKVIQDDVRDMNNNAVGGKTVYKANGIFMKLDQLVEKHIFI